MIDPTVGRMVWYYPDASDPGPMDYNGPRAGIVVHVWNREYVNLVVFDANGRPFQKASVLLARGDPLPGQCGWMPPL